MKATKIARVLSSLKLDGWTLISQEQERSTLHLTIKGAIETSIDASRKQAEVTIYKEYGDQVGDARFTLFSDDEATIKRRVKEALLICGTAKKQGWPLLGKQRYPDVKTADPAIVKAFREGKAGAKNLAVWKRMRKATPRSAKLNHAELHLTWTRNQVRNSAGIVAKSEATSLFIEAIMTTKKGKKETEFHNAVRVGRLRDFAPEAFIKETAKKAKDVLTAREPASIHDGPVLLSDIALRDFWAPDLTTNTLVFHANAQAKHRKLSHQEPGKRLTVNEGFTLRSNPLLPFNPASGRFDNEGTPSKIVTVIEKGVCKEFIASQRFAHYLGVPPTGAMGAIEISTGKEEERSLRSEGAIEIVSFSSFVPNSLSGDFSAEVRLGYRYTKGKRVPIKGVMFTGNLFKMLDTMRLSKKCVELERYKGPALVRFEDGCHVAGF